MRLTWDWPNLATGARVRIRPVLRDVGAAGPALVPRREGTVVRVDWRRRWRRRRVGRGENVLEAGVLGRSGRIYVSLLLVAPLRRGQAGAVSCGERRKRDGNVAQVVLVVPSPDLCTLTLATHACQVDRLRRRPEGRSSGVGDLHCDRVDIPAAVGDAARLSKYRARAVQYLNNQARVTRPPRSPTAPRYMSCYIQPQSFLRVR